MTQVTRRTILKVVAATTAAGATVRHARAQVVIASSGAFRHGVASGDPDHGSVVLWTRVTTDVDGAPVAWQVA